MWFTQFLQVVNSLQERYHCLIFYYSLVEPVGVITQVTPTQQPAVPLQPVPAQQSLPPQQQPVPQQQAVVQAKAMNVQNQPAHANHDLSQKPIVQHHNQMKQWNHTGQATTTQADEHPAIKSSDWTPNSQIPQQQVTSNYHSGQEAFSQVQQQQVPVQPSQVSVGYGQRQQLPQQDSQAAQINVGKAVNQQHQPGSKNSYYSFFINI